MSIQNIQYGRVAQAVAIILGVSLAVFFAVMMAFMFVRISEALSNLDSNATEQEQQDRIQEETDVLMEEFQDGSPAVTNIMAIQWGLMAVVTLIISLWAARRNATSPAQATGYGVVIGFSVLVLYGLLCMCSVPTDGGLKLAFMIAIPAAGAVGGQLAGGRLGPKTAPAPGMPHTGSIPQAQTLSGDAGMYYNMGVQAALGGRREEARQHFSRVLQAQPRNVAAWLQLANLADTPEDAWQYVQQARAINPSDPAVLQAVNIIWPQVAQRAAQQGPPVSQTPGQTSGRSVPPVPGSALEGITDMTPAAPAPATSPSAGITEAPTITDLPGAGTQPPPEVTEAPTAAFDVSEYRPSRYGTTDTAPTDEDESGDDAAESDAPPPPPPPPPPEAS